MAPNRENYPESLWHFPQPDVRETINLNEQGLSEGDTVDDYIDEYFENGVMVTIDPGTYHFDRTAPSGTYRDAAIVGLGDVGDVVFEMDNGNSNSWNFYAGGGTVLMDNIRIEGTVIGDQNARLRCDARDEDAEMVMKHVQMPHGQEPGSSADGTQGFYTGSADHVGTLRLLWCHVEGFGDNGAYVDGYAGENKGQVIVVGGYYANNNISNIRIGNDGSTVYRATVAHTKDIREDHLHSSRTHNVRGIRIRAPDSSTRSENDLLIDDCDVYYYEGSNQTLIDFSGSLSSSSSGKMVNCRLTNDGSGRVISDGGEDPDKWHFENISISGEGSLRHHHDLVDSCVGSDCERADTEPWMGDDVDDYDYSGDVSQSNSYSIPAEDNIGAAQIGGEKADGVTVQIVGDGAEHGADFVFYSDDEIIPLYDIGAYRANESAPTDRAVHNGDGSYVAVGSLSGGGISGDSFQVLGNLYGVHIETDSPDAYTVYIDGEAHTADEWDSIDVTGRSRSDDLDADSFEAGYDEGRSAGLDEGYEKGYEDGYAAHSGDIDKEYEYGYDDGYEVGYEKAKGAYKPTQEDKDKLKESGYDAGYEDGYNDGYGEGKYGEGEYPGDGDESDSDRDRYEEGYDDGYADAKETYQNSDEIAKSVVDRLLERFGM